MATRLNGIDSIDSIHELVDHTALKMGVPLEDDMVSLVRDLRSARHARAAKASPSVACGGGGAVAHQSLPPPPPLPPPPHGQAGMMQSAAASVWLQTSGIDAPRQMPSLEEGPRQSQLDGLVTPAVTLLRAQARPVSTTADADGAAVPFTPGAAALPFRSHRPRGSSFANGGAAADDGGGAAGQCHASQPPARSPPRGTSSMTLSPPMLRPPSASTAATASRSACPTARPSYLQPTRASQQWSRDAHRPSEAGWTGHPAIEAALNKAYTDEERPAGRAAKGTKHQRTAEASSEDHVMMPHRQRVGVRRWQQHVTDSSADSALRRAATALGDRLAKARALRAWSALRIAHQQSEISRLHQVGLPSMTYSYPSLTDLCVCTCLLRDL